MTLNTGNGYISRPASAGTGLMNILSTVMLSSDPNKQPNEVQRNSYSSATTANTDNNNSDRLKLAQKIDNTNGIQYSSTSYQQDQLKSSSSSNSSKKKKKNNGAKNKNNSKIIRPNIKFVSNGKPFNIFQLTSNLFKSMTSKTTTTTATTNGATSNHYCEVANEHQLQDPLPKHLQRRRFV